MKALALGLALAATLLTACGSDDVEVEASALPAGDNTFTILDVATDEGVTYTVRTPDERIRDVRYDEFGVVGVYDEAGALVAGGGVIASNPDDAAIPTLDLPSDPQVGYAALGIDFPLPIATEAPDAVMPEGLEEAYEEAGCTRTSQQWTESDGCTYGLMIDTCTEGTYWMTYQKRSGCAFFNWFCDCPGGSDAGQFT